MMKPKKTRFRKFLRFIFTPFRSKKTWVIFNIIMSYVMSYVAPIFILYMYMRDRFFKEVVIGSRYTLSFLGFMIVSIVVLLVLLVKILIKAIKSKPSYGKYIVTTSLALVALFIPFYFLLKLYNFTYLLEVESGQFFDTMRLFIVRVKNSVLIFAGCITMSTVFKFIALTIDKEYVRKLDWL